MDDCFAYRTEASEEAFDWAPSRPAKPAQPWAPLGFYDDGVPDYSDYDIDPSSLPLTDEQFRGLSDEEHFALRRRLFNLNDRRLFGRERDPRTYSLTRMATAFPDDVAACGVRLGRNDVAVRIAYTAATLPYSVEDWIRDHGCPPVPHQVWDPVNPSGETHVALLVLHKPDEDPRYPGEGYELSLKDYAWYIEEMTEGNELLPLIGIYEEGCTHEPAAIAGLRRCFRFIDGRWVDRSYYACTPLPPEPTLGGSARGAFPEFDKLFQKAAAGKSIASVDTVRSLFMGQRSGTAEAKRAAWCRTLNKAKRCGYGVSGDIISNCWGP